METWYSWIVVHFKMKQCPNCSIDLIEKYVVDCKTKIGKNVYYCIKCNYVEGERKMKNNEVVLNLTLDEAHLLQTVLEKINADDYTANTDILIVHSYDRIPLDCIEHKTRNAITDCLIGNADIQNTKLDNASKFAAGASKL